MLNVVQVELLMQGELLQGELLATVSQAFPDQPRKQEHRVVAELPVLHIPFRQELDGHAEVTDSHLVPL